jgi:hypothetical protein
VVILPAYRHEKAGFVKQRRLVGRRPNSLEMAGEASHNGTTLKEGPSKADERNAMPTLFRFVVNVAVLAGIAYGAMFALVMFVEPKKAEISVRIPLEKKLDQQQKQSQ